MLYDVNGKIIGGISENMELDYANDKEGKAYYAVLRIFQTKRDGTKQYPFIRYPDEMQTTQNFTNSEDWIIVTNAGLGYGGKIDGIAIENGKVINDTPATYHAGSIPLTIDSEGNLGTASVSATASSLISKGIISATCGFCPIIENYVPNTSFPTVSNVTHFGTSNPRTIIGQFNNGDYALIVCTGRALESSAQEDGWTLVEAQNVCQKLGLKFAYNLDGGASSSMFLHKHEVYNFLRSNPKRVLPSFIVFNGTNTFSIPK